MEQFWSAKKVNFEEEEEAWLQQERDMQRVRGI